MSSPEPNEMDSTRRELASARSRFSGALSSAVDKVETNKSDADKSVASPFYLGSPIKRQMMCSLDTSPWSSPTKSPRSNRRRRRKEMAVDSVFHHTFVMKLFDRSVDLAQFPENTPLYPVCRAWMKNQPHNTKMAPRARTPTPEPPFEEMDEEVKAGDQCNHKERSLMEEIAHIANGHNSESSPPQKKSVRKVRSVYKMPSFVSLTKSEDNKEQLLRIPKLLSPRKSASLEVNKLVGDSSASSLLKDNMIRWRQVRSQWKQAYAVNEARYSESLSLLKSLFHS